MNFLKTDECQNVIALDFFGYHINPIQGDLTPFQYYTILKGRVELERKRNTPDEKEQKFDKLRSMRKNR